MDERVKDGEIERTNDYKYLAWWFNKKSNADRQIEKLESKLDYMIREIQSVGSWNKVGTCDELILYEIESLPTLTCTYNIETASHFRENDF